MYNISRCIRTYTKPLLQPNRPATSCVCIVPRGTTSSITKAPARNTSNFLHPKKPTMGDATTDSRPVFFFDIDNCLYSKSKNVHDHMTELIDQYFMKHLELSREDAYKLHQDYYRNYGLAIEGLVRHHKIDALEYNRQVDDAVPLEDILSPDPELRKLLGDIDRSKVKLWLFTNAYVNHGKRVVRLLGVEDMFEGMTFCDYAQERIICKPYREAFDKAMKDAGVKNEEDCYFVDDSALNCRKAQEIGWTTAHLLEDGVTPPAEKVSKYQISTLQELRSIFPQFFNFS